MSIIVSAFLSVTAWALLGLCVGQPTFITSDVLTDTANGETTSAITVDSIYKQIEDLVRQNYPKAKVSIAANKIHFEYKVQNEIGYYSNRPLRAPGDGGILGDVELVSGEYQGSDKDRLPSENVDGFHTTLVMAPFSKQHNAHLLAHLMFPADASAEFKEHFKDLISNFNASELAAKAVGDQTKPGSQGAQSSTSEQTTTPTANVNSTTQTASSSPTIPTKAAPAAANACQPSVATAGSTAAQVNAPTATPAASPGVLKNSASPPKAVATDPAATNNKASLFDLFGSKQQLGTGERQTNNLADNRIFPIKLNREMKVGLTYTLHISNTATTNVYNGTALLQSLADSNELLARVTITGKYPTGLNKESVTIAKFVFNGVPLLRPGQTFLVDSLANGDMVIGKGFEVTSTLRSAIGQVMSLRDVGQSRATGQQLAQIRHDHCLALTAIHTPPALKPQHLGSTWKIIRDMISLPNCAPMAVSGTMTALRTESVNDIDCLVVESDVSMSGSTSQGKLKVFDYEPLNLSLFEQKQTQEGDMTMQIGRRVLRRRVFDEVTQTRI